MNKEKYKTSINIRHNFYSVLLAYALQDMDFYR